MTRLTYNLKRNKDGTVTFRYNKYVEHIDPRSKGLLETYEAIKYAAISAGLPLNETTLEELLREARGLQ